MSDDDALCVSMAVATRAYLRERALFIESAFAIAAKRQDGETVDIECDDIAAVANLVDTLRPQHLDLDVGADEDYQAMMNALSPAPTMH